MDRYPDLKEVSARTSGPSAPATQKLTHEFNALLSVSLTHLDADAEMRKFFGSRVVSASNQSSEGSGASRAGGNARRQPTSQRSNLTNPKKTWWPAQMREGLTLRALSPEEVEEKERRCRWGREEAGVGLEGEKWWSVDYSKRYKGVTLSFMRTVLSGGECIIVWRFLVAAVRRFPDVMTDISHRPGRILPYCSSDTLPCRYSASARRVIQSPRRCVLLVDACLLCWHFPRY